MDWTMDWNMDSILDTFSTPGNTKLPWRSVHAAMGSPVLFLTPTLLLVEVLAHLPELKA